MSLIAEAVRKERTDGTVNLAACQDFFFAGPAFTLDEASGDAAAGISVLTVIDCEGEKINAFPGIGRGDSSGQNDGFAGGDQCGARGLLSHASGLKDQPLSAGKLDGYFMLGRHIVLVSFCSLGKSCGRNAQKGAEIPAIESGCAQKSGMCTGERILPACLFVRMPGPHAADSCAQPLAADTIRQVHQGPRFWVERGP